MGKLIEMQNTVANCMKEGKENESKAYTSYLKEGDKYAPIGSSVDALPSGFYIPINDVFRNETYLLKKEVIMPKLYILPNEIQKNVLEDIKTFWESEDRYRRFGNVYKRNILLYSVPGNGKTSLINLIANKLIEEYNGVVICIENVTELQSYGTVMNKFRSVEPNRKVLTIIEDFERLAQMSEQEALILQNQICFMIHLLKDLTNVKLMQRLSKKAILHIVYSKHFHQLQQVSCSMYMKTFQCIVL